MLTVEKAREISDIAAAPIVEKEMKKISKAIEKSAKQGSYAIKYECKYSYSIRRMVATKCQAFGYSTYVDNFYPIIKIFWKKEE